MRILEKWSDCPSLKKTKYEQLAREGSVREARGTPASPQVRRSDHKMQPHTLSKIVANSVVLFSEHPLVNKL